MSDLEDKLLNFCFDSLSPSEIFPLTFSIQYNPQSFINNTKYHQKHSIWWLLSATLRKRNINLNCWYAWGLVRYTLKHSVWHINYITKVSKLVIVRKSNIPTVKSDKKKEIIPLATCYFYCVTNCNFYLGYTSIRK
jgi:hypothetical protein